MGQAWCKEKTSKAQDSKSPLDRVFVRCAHRIYPSLKEEGSVLGGATQRVTSSEIGYAGSPPREVLARGRSIDSVDRPFQPSDWVDVNLEVPSTPRASSVLTNLTVDTTLYPATTPTSSCSNLKDITPVPPPRRRKKNRGRPLPPKPDELPVKSSNNLKRADGTEEPLYSSVKSPKTSGDEQDGEDEIKTDKSCSYQEDSKHEGKRTKEIYEHKVNGTGRIIPSDVVSGKRTSDDRKSCRSSESGHHHKKVHEDEEYEIFTKHQSLKDSSTPNHRHDRISKAKDLERPINDSVENAEKTEANTRTKSYSTVSLPNYDELDISRHPKKRTNVDTGNDEKTKARRPVRCSTVSLPAETLLSPFSEKTTVRLEDYIPRRGSIEHLAPYQVLGKLDRSENGDVDDGFVKYDPSKLEDWDLSDISNCELNHQRRFSFEIPSVSEIKYEKQATKDADVVDFSHNAEMENSNRTSSSSVKKPEAFGKLPIHEEDEDENERPSKYHDDWIVSEHRPHMRYFDPPTLAENCRTSSECDAPNPPVTREPFFLDESKHLSVLDTIGESCRNGSIIEESDRSEQSRMIFSRSLSNESEPYEDVYESKELRNHRQVTSNLIRTISEESLPREMLENVDQQLDEFFDEKLAKDVHNKLKKDCVEPKVTVKTPPPSPEPRIKPEILDNDHSTLLKVLKEEAAEESNLSSMTPSLTELEAALSDMLEKEDSQEERAKDQDKTEDGKLFTHTASSTEKPIEPAIVPVEKTPISFKDDSENVVQENSMIETRGRTSDKILVDEDFEERIDEVPVSLGQVLEEEKPAAKVRKVSFCAWEENRMTEIDLKNYREFIDREKDLDKDTVTDQREDLTLERFEEHETSRISTKDTRDDSKAATCFTEVPPEKPSRLYKNLDDLMDHVENIPTPPRRKNKGSLSVGKKETETSQNGSAIADAYPDDRLI